MLKISAGRIARPVKCVIYGSEGIGKSTLAAQLPDPLFIDTEGGTAQLDVRRIETPKNWGELLADILEVAATDGICETLVIDTADWAEQLAIDHVCQRNNVKSIEAFGYGKGYTYVAEEWQRFLAACNTCIAHGINVCVVAHAKMRKQELPDETGAFDRWEMKLSRQVAPLLKEWADLLLFLNYKTVVVTTDNNTKKAQGGTRVMYTTHHPCWDAKNRYGLAEELPLGIEGIAHIFGIEQKARPVDALRQMMEEAGITEEQLRGLVAAKGHYGADVAIDDYADEFVEKWVIRHFTNIVNTIKKEA